MQQNERDAVIARIAALIEGQKEALVPAVRLAIQHHIASQSVGACLTIVARDPKGQILETFAPTPPNGRYVKALTAFVLKRGFEGKALDSGLSDSTAEEVAAAFAGKLEVISDELTETMLPFLLRSEVFVASLSGALAAAYRGTIPHQMKSQLTSILTRKLKVALSQHVDTSSIAAVKMSIAKVVASSVASPLGAKMAAMVVHTLLTSLKPILIKLLASTALKAAILSKIKAIIIASFLGAFIKLLAVKLGISTGVAFAWVLLPALLAWLAYEAMHFPEKLAANVAGDVAKDLESGFQQTGISIAEAMVTLAITECAGVVAREVIRVGALDALVEDALA